jgi:hypothetical protein
MRRLPMLPIVGAIFLLLVALPAVAQTKTLEGTWIVTQGLDLGSAAGKGAGFQLPLAYELLHLDADTEVREQSSLFRPESCGREWYVAFGVPMRIPFSASPGIGHWAFGEGLVKVSSYHLLYDCSGNALGVAWAVREAKAVYEDVSSSAGQGEPLQRVVAWEGQTSISFFTLTGEPLPLPVYLMPIFPGTDLGVTRLSGPFRAQRAFGEPTR